MIELTDAEKLAVDILRPHQSILRSIATPEGNLEINKLYDFYFSLVTKLKNARDIRKGNFEEAEIRG